MSEAELLAGLPRWAFEVTMLLARLGAAVMALPGLGEAEIPQRIRLGLGLALVVLLLPGLQSLLPPAPDSVPETLRLLLIEVAVGLWLGGLARLVMIALSTGGQLIALMLGLSSVLQPDVQLGGQQAATSRLLALAGTVIVLSTGLYAIPLHALVESYAVLPPGKPWPAGPGAEAMVQATGESLTLALRLAAPFVLGAVTLQVGLGLLVRIAPQLQIYFVAAPGQILGGLLLLALLLPALLGTWMEAGRAAFDTLPGLR